MHHYILACNVLWDTDKRIGFYTSYKDIIEAGHGQQVVDDMWAYVKKLYPEATYEDLLEVNKQFRTILNRRKHVIDAPTN